MAKNVDFIVSGEIAGLMEDMIDGFPALFDGFDVSRVACVMTQRKKAKVAVKLHNIGYPKEVLSDKVYIVEVFAESWKDMDAKKRNLALFHAMCGVPVGGFDELSKNYGKKKRPDYSMYLEEFAVSGGVPNWMENDAAQDPMDLAAEIAAEDEKDDGVQRSALTPADVANIGE
jgi:hypothetical protein